MMISASERNFFSLKKKTPDCWQQLQCYLFISLVYCDNMDEIDDDIAQTGKFSSVVNKNVIQIGGQMLT